MLSPELERARRVVLVLDRIGRECTRAVEDAGLGEWCNNAAVVVLSTLSLDGPARPSALLGPTTLTRGGLSNLLDRLEVGGLITRQYGVVPGDRRGVIVSITAEGAATISAINDAFARSVEQQRSRFDELVQLLRDGSTSGTTQGSELATRRATARWLESLSSLGAEMVDVFGTAGVDDPTPVRTVVALCSAATPSGTRPGELIDHTGLSSGGVSQLLDRLEAAELVRRRSGLPPDRRVVVVELTRKGRAELRRRLELVSIERLRAAAEID